MMNIAVIIRVFSRVEDAKALVEIIEKCWTKHNYSLYVAFNGLAEGYELDSSVYEKAEVIEIHKNSGHSGGASDLVQAGYTHIKDRTDLDYVLFIESDFWLLDEKLIESSIKADKDISTSIWVEKRRSLGVDCLLVKKKALDAHSYILEWTEHAEITLRNSVKEAGLSVYIQDEMRSIHSPSIMRGFCNLFVKTYGGGRFKIFDRARVITNHIEDLYLSHVISEKTSLANSKNLSPRQLSEAMAVKKALANTMLNKEFFEGVGFQEISFFERHAPRIAIYIPQSHWYRTLFSKN